MRQMGRAGFRLRAAWGLVGPALVRASGIATMAAGVLRRDRMPLHPADVVSGQSWHNHGHDLASGVVYASLLGAPLLLARRFRGDPGGRPCGCPRSPSRSRSA
jgi:Protein of unknown function (DUF998)